MTISDDMIGEVENFKDSGTLRIFNIVCIYIKVGKYIEIIFEKRSLCLLTSSYG